MLVIPYNSPANDLPPETKRHIASYNDLPEKNKWMRVNKDWEKALNDEKFWEEAGRKLSSFTLFKTIKASRDSINSLQSLDFFRRNLMVIPHHWRVGVSEKVKEVFSENLNENKSKKDLKKHNEFIKDQLIKQNLSNFYIVKIEKDENNDITRKVEYFVFDGFRVRFNYQLTLEIFSLFTSNRVEDINKFHKINKAIDCLLVWECLSKNIQNDAFHAEMDSYDSIDELLKQSKLLKKWCVINQAELLNINTLDLSNLKKYEIHSLPDVIWEFLPNLQRLYAENLKLTSLPASIGFCTKLRTLDLSNNCLLFLPDSFSLLKNLNYLSLSQNQFTSFPMCILELQKLQRFQVKGNHLTSLPEDISKCKQLINLNVSFNHLSSLPDSIGELENLQKLNLNSNHLDSLPDNLSKLKELRRLFVNSNHLSALPKSILKLQQLLEIDISNNDGNFTGVYLPDGYQSTHFANIEVIADKIPTLTNPICSIQ